MSATARGGGARPGWHRGRREAGGDRLCRRPLTTARARRRGPTPVDAMTASSHERSTGERTADTELADADRARTVGVVLPVHRSNRIGVPRWQVAGGAWPVERA